MNRFALLSVIVLCALSVSAGNVERPRPFDAQLLQTQDLGLAVNVNLGERLPAASVIYFIVEVFDSAGEKIGQFSAKADVPGKIVARREVSLVIPGRMKAAASVAVWASGYRRSTSDEVVAVRFPPECGSFCLVGRNECNLYCAEQNSNVASYRCYSDGVSCYYDCLCF